MPNGQLSHGEIFNLGPFYKWNIIMQHELFVIPPKNEAKRWDGKNDPYAAGGIVMNLLIWKHFVSIKLELQPFHLIATSGLGWWRAEQQLNLISVNSQCMDLLISDGWCIDFYLQANNIDWKPNADTAEKDTRMNDGVKWMDRWRWIVIWWKWWKRKTDNFRYRFNFYLLDHFYKPGAESDFISKQIQIQSNQDIQSWKSPTVAHCWATRLALSNKLGCFQKADILHKIVCTERKTNNSQWWWQHAICGSTTCSGNLLQLVNMQSNKKTC